MTKTTEMKKDTVTNLFGFDASLDAVQDRSGNSVAVEVLEDRSDFTKNMVPDKDPNYVFPVDDTVSVAMALDARVNTPVLLLGGHGSGKSTLAEQVCAATNRPCMRVQHSVDTEGSDIVGQWVLEGDKTVFELGPLARAMRDGMVYIADEYDFALPNVLAIYQAVLEGAPLFIKQAPEHLSIIKPHRDFRFMATGNTNGSGDETGLYQGTQIQNAANYSRFGITIKIDYQSPESEAKIIANRVGKLPEADMKGLMEFVHKIRQAYENKTITNTISTREIIMVANLAVLKGRKTLNWKYAIDHAFCNRMSSVDAAAVRDFQQRVFG